MDALDPPAFPSDQMSEIYPPNCVALETGLFLNRPSSSSKISASATKSGRLSYECNSVVAGEWNGFTVVARNMTNEDLTLSQPHDGAYVNELVVEFQRLGKPASISESSKRHKNKIIGVSLSKKRNAVTTKITDNGDGSFNVAFLCSSGGRYAVSVGFKRTWSEMGNTRSSLVEYIKDSPFEIRMFPPIADPSHSIISGVLAEDNSCQCGESKVLIQLFDPSGIPVRGGGHNIKVTLSPQFEDQSSISQKIMSPLGKKRMGAVDGKVEDHGDGYYTGTFTVTRSGEYSMWVRIGGWLCEAMGGAPALQKTNGDEDKGAQPRKKRDSSSKPKVFPLTAISTFPRKVYVLEGPPHVRTSSLDLSRFQGNTESYGGQGMTTSVGVRCQFFIHLRDIYSNYANCENNAIEVMISYSRTDKPVPFSVTEKKMGVYEVDFRPQTSGEISIVCTMRAVVDDGQKMVDPYDHRYFEELSEGQAEVAVEMTPVKVAGCPFKIFVHEIPLADRLCAEKSILTVLSSKSASGGRSASYRGGSSGSSAGFQQDDDDDTGAFAWGESACLGGGAIALVKLQMRDKKGSMISLDNLTEENLSNIAAQLKQTIAITLRKIDKPLRVVPEHKAGGFNLLNVSDVAAAESLKSLKGAGPEQQSLSKSDSLRARRENFKTKFSRSSVNDIGDSDWADEGKNDSAQEKCFEPEFEVSLCHESFNMMSMIGASTPRRFRGGRSEILRDSILLKVSLPVADDLFAFRASFNELPFGNVPLVLAVVPQLILDFCPPDGFISVTSKINDGFMYMQSCEVGELEGLGGRRGRFGSSVVVGGNDWMQALPQKVMKASRTYHEITQSGVSAEKAPCAIIFDARYDAKLSSIAANAIGLLSCVRDDLNCKLKVLLMAVVNCTGGCFHEPCEEEDERSETAREIAMVWQKIRRLQSQRDSMAVKIGDLITIFAKTGLPSFRHSSETLLTLRAVLFKYVCDRSALGGCSVEKVGSKPKATCKVRVGDFVVDFVNQSVFQDAPPAAKKDDVAKPEARETYNLIDDLNKSGLLTRVNVDDCWNGTRGGRDDHERRNERERVWGVGTGKEGGRSTSESKKEGDAGILGAAEGGSSIEFGADRKVEMNNVIIVDRAAAKEKGKESNTMEKEGGSSGGDEEKKKCPDEVEELKIVKPVVVLTPKSRHKRSIATLDQKPMRDDVRFEDDYFSGW